MYLLELVGGLRRRWWVALIGLLGTAVLVFGAFTLVPSEQDVSASLMILPTANAANEAGNPYLVLGGLEPAADMLAAAMNSGATHESLAPSRGTGTFEVTRDTGSSGPLLLVQVTDTNPSRALTLLNSVTQAMPTVLAKLQAQVAVRPSSNLLTLTEVTRDTKPAPSYKKQIRAMLAVGAAGLALTVFGTNAVDGLIRRRADGPGSARKRATGRGSSDDAPPRLTWAEPAS